MPKLDETESLAMLQTAIREAIGRYKSNHPRRAASTHRRTNIDYIAKMVNDAKNPEDLLSNLEDYFSNDYYTGILDRSVLEDLIAEAILDLNKKTQEGFNAFGYAPKNHLQHHEKPEKAIDEKTILPYFLDDFVYFALDKYVAEKQGNIPTYRDTDIKKIRDILSGCATNKVELIEIALNQFTHSFNSHLKKYIRQSLNHFQSNLSKEFATRIWEPDNPSNPEKVMIFLHGWHDSVNSADQVAREAVKKGFKVIAYDHRGHGYDIERQKRGISTDLLRIDFRKFLCHVTEKYPQAELALAGHSMGGAILTAESRFINLFTHSTGEKPVKSVSLFAPAVMSGIDKMLSPAKLLYRNMHPDVQLAQQASTRFGGHGPTLLGLLNLMCKAAGALAHLFQEVNSTYAYWHIYSGKKDASVNYSEFKLLPNLSNQRKVSFFSRCDHALQFGRHSGAVIRAMLKDIEPCFGLSSSNSECLKL